METVVNYLAFEGDGGEVDPNLLENITYEQRKLVEEMMRSGYYQDGIWIDKCLEQDLTINLEKLELAVSLSVMALEANSQDDITLKLRGLDQYYKFRGIEGNEKQEREERTFILGFVTSIAAEASERDTLEVKFVA